MPSFVEGCLMQITQKTGINYIDIFRQRICTSTMSTIRLPAVDNIHPDCFMLTYICINRNISV
jgi:hypothetical protein